MARVHVLANTTPRVVAARDVVVRTLREAGHEPVLVAGATATAASAALHDAVRAGAGRVVAVGGDGIVHLAVQALATTDTVLGVVPVGTGNDFARTWALPGDPAVATRRALGDAVSIDLVRAGDRWIASVATAGFSADVNAIANGLRWPRGSLRYTAATLRTLPGFAARDVVLAVDGRELAVRAALVAVANTPWFGGGMRICPDADARDGQLDVAIIGDVGRVELLRVFPRVYRGTHATHPAVRFERGRVVELRSGFDALWGDGEPVAALPCTLEAVPDALRLAGAPA